MKIQRKNFARLNNVAAFSIAETMVAVGALGIMIAAFFAGSFLSLSIVDSARETMRATQIMTERMDTLRVKSFDDVLAMNNKISLVPFNPIPGTRGAGLTYTVRVSVVNAPLGTESYAGPNMKQASVFLTWRSGKQLKQAEMSTFVSRYGMQNYKP